MKRRCEWAKEGTFCKDYHDQEWGVPLHDDRLLFEYIVLDGFQAGLSWETVLKKRENFRKAFDNFDAKKIAAYDQEKMEALRQDAGIIRNRLKIKAAIQNARAFLQIQKEFGSFDVFIWQFVGGKPKQNKWKKLKDLPAKTPEAEAMSRALIQRGFKFVGPTICYAFMQAAGMVNDHTTDCFRYREVQQKKN